TPVPSGETSHARRGSEILPGARFTTSRVNPPLAKALCALPTVLLGAQPPSAFAVATGFQFVVGASFARANAARYQSLYFAARCVVALLSVCLGVLIWRFARRLYGPRAGLLAAACYALLPESLAHGGLATMDLVTGLGFLASIYAFWRFTRTGRIRDWGWLVAAMGFSFLVRFTAAL